MVEEVKKTDTNTKTQLSLAAALFFSPLVQNMLSNKNRDISDQDREFIRGYIKFGYITLLLGCITIGAGVMNYLFALNILNIVYTVSIFILLILLIISIVSILSDIKLWKSSSAPRAISSVVGSKKDILLKYIPLYNLYLWYTLHTFDKPNWRIKESLLWRIAVCLICLTGNITITTLLFILMILRIASLMSDIDIFTLGIKQTLTQLFFKNPEELRGYVSGTLAYLGKMIKKIFVSSLEHPSIVVEITKEKEHYAAIIEIHDHTILQEYILGMLLTIGLIYGIHPDFSVRTYPLCGVLWITRYISMAIQLQHLPHLPIARELVLLGKKIVSIFKK